MSRNKTLQVPKHVGGTDLRPVLALVPVTADDARGGAEIAGRRDSGKGRRKSGGKAGGKGGGKAGLLLKGALGTVLVGHLATAVAALRDAAATPDLVWDTVGIAKKTALVKIALVPIAGPAAYTRDIKPKLTTASDALRLQGG